MSGTGGPPDFQPYVASQDAPTSECDVDTRLGTITGLITD